MKGAMLCLALVLLAGCGNRSSEPPPAEKPVVRVAEVEHGTLERVLVFGAVLLPKERAELAFQSAGVLDTRLVEVGYRVGKGSVLASLRNPNLGPSQQAARGRLQQFLTERDQARRDLERLQALVNTGAVGIDRVEQQNARLRSLDAQVSQAEADLKARAGFAEDALLRAPFDGLVAEIRAEPGEFVAAGATVVSLGGESGFEVEIAVPAAVAAELRVGDALPIAFPQLLQQSAVLTEVSGEVSEIGRIGTPGTGLFPVVVAVPASHPDLRPGLHAEVGIRQKLGQGLLVPLSTLVDPVGHSPGVLRVVDGVAAPVPVEILARAGSQVLVAADLNPQDRVIVAGHQLVTAGDAVQIIP